MNVIRGEVIEMYAIDRYVPATNKWSRMPIIFYSEMGALECVSHMREGIQCRVVCVSMVQP
jgi:hypothetical protein